METKTTEFERNMFLARLIEGDQKRTKEHLQRVKNTIELCETETKVPELALKAYCFLGDSKKTKELILKVPKINKTNIKVYLSSALESGNYEVLEALLDQVNDIHNDTIRSAISRCATMGYNKALQILFNKAKLENIDEATLNTAMVGCILDGKLKTLKILCENARSQWLNSWQKQLTNNPRSAVSHTKDAFGQGLKIIRNEIAKRKIVKKFSESTNKEIEI